MCVHDVHSSVEQHNWEGGEGWQAADVSSREWKQKKGGGLSTVLSKALFQKRRRSQAERCLVAFQMKAVPPNKPRSTSFVHVFFLSTGVNGLGQTYLITSYLSSPYLT